MDEDRIDASRGLGPGYIQTRDGIIASYHMLDRVLLACTVSKFIRGLLCSSMAFISRASAVYPG